jgi:lipoate---protein ligase
LDSHWRLIPCLDAPGDVQMAIDRWLIQQHQQGLHPPTLRFYTWSPVAISLGYHQRRWPEHWRSLCYQGQAVELVQRPSGGRAVLHQGDLTYAIVTSGIAGNRVQVYQSLCEFLIQGWRSLGIPLHFGDQVRGYQQNANCFGLATGADLVLADGTKFIGSAQYYAQGAVLQHGSMRLNPDLNLWNQVFGDVSGIEPPSAIRQLNHATIVDALSEAARTVFGIQLHSQPLNPSEWEAMESSGSSV